MSGCYYMQAAGGQWEVLRKREPIDEVLADPNTQPDLAARLRLLTDARDFSVSELGLPDNRSYRTYTDLERDYVVWNVFATPEFSLEPEQWCFPVAGCVNYRGYFSKDAAIAKAQRLKSKGFDVAVGGVAAYSTLGKFSDPILSTMMQWDDVDLVAVLFHELAHQIVYVKDDSSFNESFATSVEQFGIERWLNNKGRGDDYSRYVADRQDRQLVTAKIESARSDLLDLFGSDVSESEMREKKKLRFSRLAADLAQLEDGVNGEPSTEPDRELNNAHLVTSSLYEGRLPQFQKIYTRCQQSLDCFYAAAKSLAALNLDERNAELSTGNLRYFDSGLDD